MNKLGSIYLFNVRPIVLHHGFIGKYGFTKDLSRRSKEHAKTYHPSSTYLVCESKVDLLRMREAEHYLRTEFIAKDMHIDPSMMRMYDLPKGRELILVPWTEINWIRDLYKEIAESHG